jgi:hypothetical protein
MVIQKEDYFVGYDPTTSTIYCRGVLRLNGMQEYSPIVELLKEVIERDPATIVLDLQGLQFLNSSGINMLSRFTIEVRQKQTIQIIVKGSKAIPWQEKSLRNLQRLMPALRLEIV